MSSARTLAFELGCEEIPAFNLLTRSKSVV